MRDRIKQAARDLLIMHGYRGLRFGDIADRLQTTRANIHYHFGTKSKLVEEVIDEYVTEVIRQMGAVWESDLSYAEKVVATMELNRRRYLRFNNSNDEGAVAWSLISRMRLEAGLLSPPARQQLREFTKRMERFVADAIAQAQSNYEIAADAPVEDIAVQIVSIIDSAGPITLDAGSFARLEHLYLAHMRVIAHAYVSRRKPKGGLRPARAAAGS
jgi:TetR/AcrR family transcriptional regulator, transcriptional repressor for nem operon